MVCASRLRKCCFSTQPPFPPQRLLSSQLPVSEFRCDEPATSENTRRTKRGQRPANGRRRTARDYLQRHCPSSCRGCEEFVARLGLWLPLLGQRGGLQPELATAHQGWSGDVRQL